VTTLADGKTGQGKQCDFTPQLLIQWSGPKSNHTATRSTGELLRKGLEIPLSCGQLCSGDSGGHFPIDLQSPCLLFSWVARIFGKGGPDFIHHSEREIKLRGKSGAQMFALSAQLKPEIQKRRPMAF
jgi:hypothetical protein